MKDAVVYDIDNTLIDSRKRFYISLLEAANGRRVKGYRDLSPEERNSFWNIFLSPKYMDLDTPIIETIEEVNKKYDAGLTVIILTGRPEYLYEETVKQLKKFNVKYHRLYMRPNHDTNPDYIYKPMQIKRILAEGFNILEYHDDSVSALERVKSQHPKIFVCKHGFGEIF